MQLKKIISLMVAILLLVNCFPIATFAESITQETSTETPDESADLDGTGATDGPVALETVPITLTVPIVDAVRDVVYGWDGTTYRFEKALLEGVAADDDVMLVADVTTEDVLVADSEISLTLSNFRLEGADAAGYTLEELNNLLPITKQIRILPKEVVIVPEKLEMYVGQPFPTDGLLQPQVGFVEQFLDGDDVQLQAAFVIESNGSVEIGTYPIILKEAQLLGADAQNYIVNIPEDLKFTIRDYQPEEEAYVKDAHEGNFIGATEAVLTAPDGFLIRAAQDTEWSEQYTFQLQETLSGIHTYYLRNDDPESECYQATCQKEYAYTAVQTIPSFGHIRLELATEESRLYYLDDGVFACEDLMVSVTVEGGPIALDTTIYLGEQSVVVTADKAVEQNGRFCYTAEFCLEVPEGQCKTQTLTAYAKNIVGTSSRYPATEEDTFDGTDTSAMLPVTVDKTKPFGEVKNVNGNYRTEEGEGAIFAEFSVSDQGSGIKKVEYLWDNGFWLEDGGEFQTDYAELHSYTQEQTAYALILPWDQAQLVNGNKHTLHLRITDRAGNVNDQVVGTDRIGTDDRAPKAERINIRMVESDSILDAFIRFLSLGTFSRKQVQIAVQAHDHESDTEFYASGIKTLLINGREAQKDENTNEYILQMDPDDAMANMQITITDHTGNKVKLCVIDVPEKGEILSDRIIVEDNQPHIDFGDFLKQGYDVDGKVWFGIDKSEVELNIDITDDDGDPEVADSGLYSVLIKDNAQELYHAIGLVDTTGNESAMLVQHRHSLAIKNLADGEHTISVTVVDNCGNETTSAVTFFVDKQAPDKKGILITAPEAKELDGNHWFHVSNSLTVRTNVADATSGVKKIAVTINGQTTTYYGNNIIQNDAGECYVLTNRKAEPDENHKITISAKVTDHANNTVEYDAVTVCVDTQAPTITSCIVQKAPDTLLDKILNVLTFGIYSNTSLLFTIQPQDAENDSGIAYAQIKHAGLDDPVNMTDNGDGTFSYVLKLEQALFESDLEIKVYDCYGNASTACTSIEDKNGNKTGTMNVVLEQELPFLQIKQPEADYSGNEEQLWYKEHKDIELAVKDEHSGIRNIAVTVNGSVVEQDKESVKLLCVEVTEAAEEKITEASYTFNTADLTACCVESPADGRYQLDIEVTDNAGNVYSQQLVYYLDLTAPIIDSIDFVTKDGNTTVTTREFVNELVYGHYFDQNFSVTVHVSDPAPSSGLCCLSYWVVPCTDDIANDAANNIANTRTTVKIDENGKATFNFPETVNKGWLFVEAHDNTQHTSDKVSPKACVVDSDAPAIAIISDETTQYRDAENNPLYTQTKRFTVTITDTASGLKEFGYQLDAEKAPYERKVIQLEDKVYGNGAELGDGWVVKGVDANLVTQVEKTFVFAADDNDLKLTFDAQDNALKERTDVVTETFTVDTIAPKISVVFATDDDTDVYYSQDRTATVTITERNFDPTRIKIQIQNTFGDVPQYTFTKWDSETHTAEIVFDEGDYTFELTGDDLGHHAAEVTFSGGNENLFYVDKTSPSVRENFLDFNNQTGDYFRENKTAQIEITEHNFDPKLVGLKIFRKAAGTQHTTRGVIDATEELLKKVTWSHSGDVHTISFVFAQDGVYYIEMSPADLAGNRAPEARTVIFEIDKTAPIVVQKNGQPVNADATEMLDLYTYDRADASTPTVEFADNNLKLIRYELTTYVFNNISVAESEVKPVMETGEIESNIFTLPDFDTDGIYAVKLTAVDKAGNESAVNINTYARMIEREVLALIMDSDPNAKTGLYSLEYENGEPMSKKPSDFLDLSIFVLAPKDEPVEIVLRDNDGNTYNTDAQFEVDNNIYGIGVYRYLLRADYFRENFREDADVELCLSVSTEQSRIDLAQIHIDNITPTCELPEGLKNWGWFIADEACTLTITNISENIDPERCKIYDNGHEIQFVYSAEDAAITFKLAEGWHDVGIGLCDMAGNIGNIPEIRNVHVGYFWMVVFIGAGVLILGGTVAVCIDRRKKRLNEQDD